MWKWSKWFNLLAGFVCGFVAVTAIDVSPWLRWGNATFCVVNLVLFLLIIRTERRNAHDGRQTTD
jgi:hypothetical protein